MNWKSKLCSLSFIWCIFLPDDKKKLRERNQFTQTKIDIEKSKLWKWIEIYANEMPFFFLCWSYLSGIYNHHAWIYSKDVRLPVQLQRAMAAEVSILCLHTSLLIFHKLSNLCAFPRRLRHREKPELKLLHRKVSKRHLVHSERPRR